MPNRLESLRYCNLFKSSFALDAGSSFTASFNSATASGLRPNFSSVNPSLQCATDADGISASGSCDKYFRKYRSARANSTFRTRLLFAAR